MYEHVQTFIRESSTGLRTVPTHFIDVPSPIEPNLTDETELCKEHRLVLSTRISQFNLLYTPSGHLCISNAAQPVM